MTITMVPISHLVKVMFFFATLVMDLIYKKNAHHVRREAEPIWQRIIYSQLIARNVWAIWV